jgi:hypothetical protein
MPRVTRRYRKTVTPRWSLYGRSYEVEVTTWVKRRPTPPVDWSKARPFPHPW